MFLLCSTSLTILTIAHFVVVTLSAFNASDCNISKKCVMQPPNCHDLDGSVDNCTFVFAYAKSLLTSDLAFEMDLVGRVENPNELHYVSFGFSDDDVMGDEPVISCTFRQNDPAVPKHSRNDGKNNYLLTGDKETQLKLITSSVTNGMSHCRISQDFSLKLDSNFRFDPTKQHFLLGALGPAEPDNALSYHQQREVIAQHITLASAPEAKTPEAKTPEVKTPEVKSFSLGLSASTKKLFVRLHGLFMIVAWLTCVSLAIFSARYLRDTFDVKIGNIKLWFHVHRTLNLIAVLLIVASTVFIATAKNFRWTGPSFTKNVNANLSTGAMHSLFGTVSVLLAVIQPFNSLLRCAPDHSKRSVFNIIHRIIGLFGLTCALIAIFIAIYVFESHFNSGPNLAKAALTVAVCVALALVGTVEEVENRCFRQRAVSFELSTRINGKHFQNESEAFSYQQNANGKTLSQKIIKSIIFGLFAAVVLSCTIMLTVLIE